ncbi:hypothetical protein JB92DRAFT_3125501 [Gautieria morchelliformis]|nr:hypothetical protein JB92DRAFT_3125501 [Gautieria morchelliformis]
MAPVPKQKALQEINLTQLPTRSTVPKKASTHDESSSRTRPLVGPAPTETITTNPSSRTRLTEKGLEYQIQEQARAQEAWKVEVAALRDEGLGDEEIAEFLNDPNANDSAEDPEPQPRPGRIQANEFAFKGTTAVVTAASRPSVSKAVRRQTASSPIPLRSAVPPQRPYASSPDPHPENSHMDRTHEEQGLVDTMDPVGMTSGCKRTHAATHDGAHATHSDADADSTQERPEKLRKFHKQKPKAADYEGLANSLLTMAMTEFQVRVCTKNAFPDTDVCEDWAEECWRNACDRKGEMHSLTLRLTTLITARASTIRGRVKDKAVTKVVSHYNFKHGQQPRQIEHNKVLAAQLLEDDGYVYEDFEESTGIYQHPILENIVLEQWFPKKKRADGITYSASFHPIPEPTIALVFTAVEYAVSQWTSGIHVKGSNFTEVGYAKVYRRHLSGLEAWCTYSERSGQALARHQQRLHDHGRAHAGFPNIVTNPRKPAFNAAKFARATQALDDDEHSDG